MADPRAKHVEQLLREVEWLRTLARHLIGDEDRALDLVQDTVLASLQTQAKDRSPHRPWLARVAANLAARARRSDHRRRRRERSVAKPEAQLDNRERLAIHRSVVDAVGQLEEPYATAIVLRYVDDLPPREIAERLGVPVETVKTRLRRGLHQLRGKLDTELGDRGRWMAALVPVLGSEFPTREAGTNAATAALARRTKWALMAGTAALAGALAVVTTTDSSPTKHTAAMPPTPVNAAEQRADSNPHPTDSARRTVAASRAGSPRRVTIRGRCVDSDGAPLPGATVEWTGSPDAQRYWLYRRDHGPVEWSDLETTTDADGRFEIRFEPPSPWRYSLLIHRRDTAYVMDHWSDGIGPGGTLELGEFTVPRGTKVSGSIVDNSGARIVLPESYAARIHLRRVDSPEDRVTPADSIGTEIRPDGSFELPYLAAPGRWRVSTRGVSSRGFEIEIQGRAQRFSVAANAPKTDHRIRGRVVDSLGQPVPNAVVRALGGTKGRTDASGQFVVYGNRRTNPDVPVRFEIEAKGFASLRTKSGTPWGTEDMRLALTRLFALRIEVRDVRGRAIEKYGVRIEPTTWESRSTGSLDRFHGWSHPGGVATITRVAPGPHRIRLVPGKAGKYGELVQEIDARRGAVLRFELPELVRQPVVIVDAHGNPVAGSRIELIDPHGSEITATSEVRPRNADGGSPPAQLQDETVTDAAGRGTVLGSAGRTLTLRCSGEHSVLIKSGIRPSDRPQRLVIQPSASLEVRALPLSVLTQWRQNAGKSSALRPAVHARTEPSQTPANQPVQFDANGIARLHHLPVGSYSIAIARRLPLHAQRTEIVLARGVRVRANTTTVAKLDLSAFATTTISGRVAFSPPLPAHDFDGPAGGFGSTIEFRRISSSTQGLPVAGSRTARVNHDGEFEAQLPAGRWRGFVQTVIDGRSRSLRTRPDLVLPTADRRSASLTAAVARLPVRFLRPDGTPAAGIWIDWNEVAARAGHSPRTDSNGRFLWVGSPDRIRVRTKVRSVQDPHLFTKRFEQLRTALAPGEFRKALERLTIDVTTFELAAGRHPERVIRLPAGWDR